MKRRIVMSLCLAACMGMLFGCGREDAPGGAEEAMAPVEDAGDGPSSQASEEETETSTVSEYLGSGRKILYGIYDIPLDKENKPAEIYFFEDGRITPVDGHEFGLTMGELSRMADDEIWAAMEEYAESRESNLSGALAQSGENRLKYGIMYLEDGADRLEPGDYAKSILCYAYESGAFPELPAYTTGEMTDELWEEWASTFPGGTEKVREAGEELYARIEESLPGIKGMFCGLPAVFIVETDASGNSVEGEAVAYPQPGSIYGSVSKFLLGEKGGTGQVYDSSYSWYGCGEAGQISYICIRDNVEMVFDGTDNENVSVDIPLNKQGLAELFK